MNGISSKGANQQLPLSDSEIATFEANGYLVKDFGLAPELIDGIVADIYPYYNEDFRANPVFAERVRNAWKDLEKVKKLAIYPEILVALEQLWGRKARAFQTLNFPIGTSQRVHSDAIHFNTEPLGFVAGVWVALEDITASNGPLVYYPGSHKLPVMSMLDLNLKGGRENYGEYEVAIDNLIKTKELVPELGTIKKGEAIIWHSNLLHGGHPHEDVNRSRHSQVTHYFFDGCSYYTPLLHDGKSAIEFNQPQWINPEKATLQSFSQRVKNKILRLVG